MEGMSLAQYAELKVAEEMFVFRGGLWYPISMGYDNDPSLMIAKRIGDFTAPAPVVKPIEKELDFSVDGEKVEPKTTLKQKKGGGLNKAKKAMKKAKKQVIVEEEKDEIPKEQVQ